MMYKEYLAVSLIAMRVSNSLTPRVDAQYIIMTDFFDDRDSNSLKWKIICSITPYSPSPSTLVFTSNSGIPLPNRPPKTTKPICNASILISAKTNSTKISNTLSAITKHFNSGTATPRPTKLPSSLTSFALIPTPKNSPAQFETTLQNGLEEKTAST